MSRAVWSVSISKFSMALYHISNFHNLAKYLSVL